METKYLAAALIFSVSPALMAGPDCTKNPDHQSCGGGGEPTLEEITARVEALEAANELLQTRLENQDFDADGFSPLAGDCDDTNPFINPHAFEYPGTPESEDLIDNDCDGVIDNQYFDLDGDGYYADFPSDPDCDDDDSNTYPYSMWWGIVEKDYNCDGTIRLEYSFGGLPDNAIGVDYDEQADQTMCEALQHAWVGEPWDSNPYAQPPSCGYTGKFLYDRTKLWIDGYLHYTQCHDALINMPLSDVQQTCN